MKKMTNSEEKMLERIVEKCQMLEENYGIEKAWDYLIDTIYDIDDNDTHSTEFFNKLWRLDEKYEKKIIKAHIEETLSDI